LSACAKEYLITALQCTNIKLKLKFPIEWQAVIFEGLFIQGDHFYGKILVVTLFVKGAKAVGQAALRPLMAVCTIAQLGHSCHCPTSTHWQQTNK